MIRGGGGGAGQGEVESWGRGGGGGGGEDGVFKQVDGISNSVNTEELDKTGLTLVIRHSLSSSCMDTHTHTH